MNKKQLLDHLHDLINDSTDLEQLVVYTKCVSVLNTGALKCVTNLAQLATVPHRDGELIFVDSENTIYYSRNGSWNSIFLLTRGGTAWSWGNNANGSLGDGLTTNKSSPVSVIGGFTDWAQISSGTQHCIGLRMNGTALAWGFNSGGRLGDSTVTSRFSPVSVSGGFTGWVQVSATTAHDNSVTAARSFGIRINGTVWSWGNNAWGAIGDGTVTDKSSPVSVVGGFSDWTQIGVGAQHNSGLRSNGTAWAWGWNGFGQHGDNTVVAKSSPVSVVGGFSDWTQVSAGDAQTLALRANGTIWSCGFNSDGRLGHGDVIHKSSPVMVIGGFTDWTKISAGSFHSIAMRANGTAWAWGWNGDGQLGDGTFANKSSPVNVAGGFTDWVDISAGGRHTVGIRANGTAWAWGNNVDGRLGDGTIVVKNSPVSVVGGFTDWVSIGAGLSHSIGLRG